MSRVRIASDTSWQCQPEEDSDYGRPSELMVGCISHHAVVFHERQIEDRRVTLQWLGLFSQQQQRQQRQIAALVAEVDRLKESSRLWAMPIRLSSLGISGYTVQKPIPVTVRPDGDEFIATFFDANISTGGDTEQEAAANLQSLIADFYDDLVVTPNEKLGPSLRRQKLVLVEFLCHT